VREDRPKRIGGEQHDFPQILEEGEKRRTERNKQPGDHS
jgi:hypothetical protein